MYLCFTSSRESLTSSSTSFSLNGDLLRQIEHASAEMTKEQQIKLIIENVRTLFEKERGKDAAKKLNLRDVITTRVETADLLQLPLVPPD